MKKPFYTLFVVITLLTGCVSDDDFIASQQRVAELNREVDSLRTELSNLKLSLNEVKDRKFVKLPTGSPTQVEARQQRPTTQAATQTTVTDANAIEKSNAPADDDLAMYQDALATYKSGDIANGVTQLARYRKEYPSGQKFEEASYYLAQAYFAERNYSYAALVLEPLVFNKPRESVNVSVAKLLRKVYQNSNNTQKLAELDQLMNPAPEPVIDALGNPMNPSTSTPTGTLEQPDATPNVLTTP